LKKLFFSLLIFKIFACGAKNVNIWLKDPPKFSKFSPAALKNEEIWLKDPLKFSKIASVAQKREYFWLKGLPKFSKSSRILYPSISSNSPTSRIIIKSSDILLIHFI